MIDKTNIDAAYWAKEYYKRFCDLRLDADTLLGWFANYRFAVSDPLTAELEALKVENQRLVNSWTSFESALPENCDATDKGLVIILYEDGEMESCELRNIEQSIDDWGAVYWMTPPPIPTTEEIENVQTNR